MRAAWGLAFAVVCGVLVPRALCLEDFAQNTSVAEYVKNFQVASNEQDSADWQARFNGDDTRFVRAGPGPGVLNYTLDSAKISEVTIEFYAKASSLTGATWLMELLLQSDSAADPWVSIGQLRSTEDVGDLVQRASGAEVRFTRLMLRVGCPSSRPHWGCSLTASFQHAAFARASASWMRLSHFALSFQSTLRLVWRGE